MTLYLTPDCSGCSQLQDALDELAMAHDVVVVSPEEQAERLPAGTRAPVLVDEDKVIQGAAGIFAYVDELKQLLADWLKYQSDTCYLD